MTDPSPGSRKLALLDADTDRLRLGRPQDVSVALGELLDLEEDLDRVVLLSDWARAWPRATHHLLGALSDSLPACIELGPLLAVWSWQLSGAESYAPLVDEILAQIFPFLQGPWRDLALERPRVRQAAGPASEGWTSLAPPPRERAWPEGRPFPPVDTVEGAQARLGWLGHDPGPVDGVLGDRTLRALHRFQALSFVEPSGELDWETVDALRLQCPQSP